MVEYQNNLKKHSNYLKKIIDETNNSTGKNILAMINELSNSVTKDIDHIKNIIKKVNTELIKSPVKDNSKDDISLNKIHIDSIRKIKLPKKEFQTEIIKSKFINIKKVPKELILSFKDSQNEETSDAKNKKKKQKNVKNVENICCSHNEALKTYSDTGYKTKISNEISNQSYLSINHFSLEFMNSQQTPINNSNTTISTDDIININQQAKVLQNRVFIMGAQNDKLHRQIDTLSNKIRHYRELESYFNEKIIDINDNHSILKEKYKAKCMEINLIEEKFEEISEKFNIILNGIKDHQKDIIEDNKNLKELLVYTLVSFYEKKYDYIKYIIDFIKNNDTFIDKSIFFNNQSRNSMVDHKKIVENLYSNENLRGRLGKTLCDYSNLEFTKNKSILIKNLTISNEIKERSLTMSIYKKIRNSSYSIQRSNSFISSKDVENLNKTSFYNLMNSKKFNLSCSNENISKEGCDVDNIDSTSKTNFLNRNEIKVDRPFVKKDNVMNILKRFKNSNENVVTSEKNNEIIKDLKIYPSINFKTLNKTSSLGCLKDSSLKNFKDNNFNCNMMVKQLSKARSQIIISRDLEELMKQKIDGFKPK